MKTSEIYEKNLFLSELIVAMKNIAKGYEYYALLDTISDLTLLVDLRPEDGEKNYYWCIRKDGTLLATNEEKVEEWVELNAHQQVDIFYIGYNNGRFSIRNSAYAVDLD